VEGMTMDKRNIADHPTNKFECETIQEKVHILAGEVLSVMKELRQEHRTLINRSLIAKRMLDKQSIKNIFNISEDRTDKENNVNQLQDTIDFLLNRFSELIPSAAIDQITYLKDKLNNESHIEDYEKSLSEAVNVLITHFGLITNRLDELEGLLQRTAGYLSEIENHFTSELASSKEKFDEDRTVENNILFDMNEMKQSFDIHSDMNTIKSVILGKIGNITKALEEKKEQDRIRLQNTESTLNEMSRKMVDIIYESDIIRQKYLETELETLHDDFTGLYNRKAYDMKIEETLESLKRYNVPSAVIIIDLDHFKSINDKFGHHIGDLTLKKVAMLFKERLRKIDFIARYGGEEFVCILAHTKLNEAREIAGNILSKIDRSEFTFKGEKVPVTVSAGISIVRKEDDAISVFERADKALYLAKNSGRNKFKTENDLDKN
jgi:diguanylate cyclase